MSLACRLFLKCFPVHRVEGGVILQHQPAFQPVTSCVSLVDGVPAHTNTLISVSKSQFCIEASSNHGYVSFAIFSVLPDSSVHFLDVVVRISRVVEVYTHQFDALAVDQDCGGDGTFVDV